MGRAIPGSLAQDMQQTRDAAVKAAEAEVQSEAAHEFEAAKKSLCE